MIQRLDTEHGRYYQTPDGIFPSVTTVLSSIPHPELDAWRESIGAEQADRISKKATTVGTSMHTFCEQYLKNENPVLDVIDKFRFSNIIPELDKITPLEIEYSSWSAKLKVAGTMDCLGHYNKNLSIIDFKSTSRLKYDGDFDNYWLQTAFYSVMAYERLGLFANNLVIIMQDVSSGECNVYEQKAKDWIPKCKAIRDAYDDKSAFFPKK